MRKQLLATLATLGMLTTAPFVLANPIEIQVNNTMSEGGSESAAVERFGEERAARIRAPAEAKGEEKVWFCALWEDGRDFSGKGEIRATAPEMGRSSSFSHHPRQVRLPE